MATLVAKSQNVTPTEVAIDLMKAIDPTAAFFYGSRSSLGWTAYFQSENESDPVYEITLSSVGKYWRVTAKNS